MEKTKRTYIRRIMCADEPAFTALMRQSQDLHDPWISPPTNSSQFKSYLHRIDSDDHEGFAICRIEDDQIAGAINLNHIVRGSFQSASLGYYVGAKFQGAGYMHEGLALLVDYAFNTMGLHRLEANIQPGNTRSRKLVESCGFTQEGYSVGFLFINGAWRDHERWCCLHQRQALRAQGWTPQASRAWRSKGP